MALSRTTRGIIRKAAPTGALSAKVVSVEFNPAKIADQAYRSMNKAMLILGFSLQKRVRNQLSREGSGKQYRGQPARSSAPGEPPVAQTGRLRNSWSAGKMNFTSKRRGSDIVMLYQQHTGGAEVGYGYILEVKKGRPFLQPAVERITSRAEKIVSHVLKKEMQRIDDGGPYA